jgi:PTS system mannose-specific IIC component
VSTLPLPAIAVLLLLWGTVVGLDLVSVPQGLLSRPLVSASVAGWLVGDLETGLRVGAVLELFALDVLPVGASRYPEYGPAAVGAALAASFLPPRLGLGVGVLLGLVVAILAGWSLGWLRHANARHVHRLAPEVNGGSVRAIRNLQWAGLGRDLLRSAAMTLLAMALAYGSFALGPLVWRFPTLVTEALIGVGLAAALSGAMRTAGQGRRLVWMGVGVAVGLMVALVAPA